MTTNVAVTQAATNPDHSYTQAPSSGRGTDPGSVSNPWIAYWEPNSSAVAMRPVPQKIHPIALLGRRDATSAPTEAYATAVKARARKLQRP
jgi:hypothetical protein